MSLDKVNHQRSVRDTDHAQGLVPSIHDPQVPSVQLSARKVAPRVGAEGTQPVRTTSTSVKAQTSVSDGAVRSDTSPAGDTVIAGSPAIAHTTVVDRAAHTHISFINGSAHADRHEIADGLTQNPSMTLSLFASEGSMVVPSANVAPTPNDAPRGEIHVGVQTDAHVTVMAYITSSLVEWIFSTKRANPLLCPPRLRTIDLPFVGVEQQAIGSPVFGEIGIKPRHPSQQSPVSLLFTTGGRIGDMFRDTGSPLSSALSAGLVVRFPPEQDGWGLSQNKLQSLALYPKSNSLLLY